MHYLYKAWARLPDQQLREAGEALSGVSAVPIAQRVMFVTPPTLLRLDMSITVIRCLACIHAHITEALQREAHVWIGHTVYSCTQCSQI